MEVFELFFYILDKFWTFMFDTQVFTGVSLGMFYIVLIMFGVMFRFLIAVPKVMPRKRERFYDVYKQDDNGSYARSRHKY